MAADLIALTAHVQHVSEQLRTQLSVLRAVQQHMLLVFHRSRSGRVSLSESHARSRFCVWLETDQAREPATATQLLRCVMTATDTAKSKSPAGRASSLIQSPSAILSQLGSSRHTCRAAELAGLVPARAGREMSASPQPRDTRAVVELLARPWLSTR